LLLPTCIRCRPHGLKITCRFHLQIIYTFIRESFLFFTNLKYTLTMKNLRSLIIFFFPLFMMGCQSDHWITLFDGETLSGWRASENAGSWKIEDGALVTSGPRSHLFYDGEVMNRDFKNFELMVDVRTIPGSNSGIYFHTEFQEEGWPEKGYECQVINSNKPAEPGDYVEYKMTGSIYAIRNTWKSPVPDNEWFNYHIVVRGKTIQTFINGELIAEYTEPDEVYRPESMKGRVPFERGIDTGGRYDACTKVRIHLRDCRELRIEYGTGNGCSSAAIFRQL